MPGLIWSREALRDLDRLHRFLRSKNEDAARRAVAAIRQGVRTLADHPLIGLPIDGLAVTFRLWPVAFGAGGYVIVYRVDAGEVVILLVRHGREAGRLP